MIKSLNTAQQAMQMEQVRIEALANNLANVDSTGFRQILTRVVAKNAPEITGQDPQTVPTAQALTRGGTAPGGRTTPPSGGTAQPTVTLHATDTRPGQIGPTGRDTDVAIMGRGYFVVQTEAGERYTRAGSFQLDNERRLVTPDGDPVLGQGGAVTLDGQEFSIEPDGTVTVDGAVRGRLRLVDFGDATRLEHEGSNRLAAPPGVEPQEVPAEEIVLAQGHLEGSNVDPIDVLVDMIAAQRAFEMQTKVLTTEDSLLDKSVNSLGRAAHV
ncbi:MAG TPA: flagellar hook-basal body protein [Candidatus Krumholzibacteria bacterium]|nr:flagellar hook-basal body protein [Candidatus Krumholzibacteria bacterium]